MDEWEKNVNNQIYEELPERIHELEQRFEELEERVADLEREAPDQFAERIEDEFKKIMEKSY